MKKISYFLAVLCLLASASQVSAQLIIRNNEVEKGATFAVCPSCF